MSSDPNRADVCPSCDASLPTDAILCVQCGYHLVEGQHLATEVEQRSPSVRRTISDNPYSAPDYVESGRSSRQVRLDSNLTDDEIRHAYSIISDANIVIPVFAISLFCGFVWPVVLPWYGFRLWSWYRLRNRHDDLRFPNSLSRNGKVAVDFQNAWKRLMFGVIYGSLIWLFILAMLGTGFFGVLFRT